MIEDIIDIHAPPSLVRQIFLDFENLHSWHSGQWINSIESLTPGKTSGEDLVPGDKMRTRIPGMTFDQTIQHNDAARIQWFGPWYGLLTGTHAYEFSPSASHPGSDEWTTLRQWESFTGILAPFMSFPSFMGGKVTLEAFKGIHADLKKRAEEVWKERCTSARHS